MQFHGGNGIKGIEKECEEIIFPGKWPKLEMVIDGERERERERELGFAGWVAADA